MINDSQKLMTINKNERTMEDKRGNLVKTSSPILLNGHDGVTRNEKKQNISLIHSFNSSYQQSTQPKRQENENLDQSSVRCSSKRRVIPQQIFLQRLKF